MYGQAGMGQSSETVRGTLRVRAFGWFVAAGVVLLSLAYAGTLVLRFGLGFDHALGLVAVFGVEESSVITWYSSLLLFGCAVVLALHAVCSRVVDDGWFPRWAGMAVIFCLLSVDEVASIHEKANVIRDRIGGEGLLTYAWVIVAAPLVVAFVLWQVRLLRALPPSVRWRMIAAGGIFVAGALGVEMLTGWYTGQGRAFTLGHQLLGGAEEILEMSGAGLFAHTLLEHLATRVGGVSLQLLPSTAQEGTHLPRRAERPLPAGGANRWRWAGLARRSTTAHRRP